MKEHSIYIHIPFCEKRCSYCDFNTYEGINHLISGYLAALTREISFLGRFLNSPVSIHTIFFGGGTPSLLLSDQFEMILESLAKTFDLSTVNEISLEANPGTVDQDYLNDLHQLGFSRISFGVQSVHSAELHLLRRIHNNQDSLNAIEWAKKAGFDNINVDLIYGLPNQTQEIWLDSIKQVLALDIQHISMYALGVEEGTPLAEWIDKGLIADPDDDLSADMYDSAVALLKNHDYLAYEISNFAKNTINLDYRCRHNLQYWHNLPYIGLGAGAHGFIEQQRTENIKGVPAYIKALSKTSDFENYKISPAVARITEIDRFTEMQETMMLGLRLLQEGVSIPLFKERFNVSPLDVFQNEISTLINKNLIEIKKNEFIRLAAGKAMISNQVFRYFV